MVTEQSVNQIPTNYINVIITRFIKCNTALEYFLFSFICIGLLLSIDNFYKSGRVVTLKVHKVKSK